MDNKPYGLADMTMHEIDQIADKILNEHGINNAKNLGLQACHEALRLAVEFERITKKFSICFDGEPAKMTSRIGLLPIDSEGMRKAVDEISRLNSELSHSHKETAMLWKVLDEARAKVERLQKERDAAVNDIENLLRCAKDKDCGTYCAHDIMKDCENGWACCGPEWRGPQ